MSTLMGGLAPRGRMMYWGRPEPIPGLAFSTLFSCVGVEGALTGSPITTKTRSVQSPKGIKPMIETVPLEKQRKVIRNDEHKARFRMVITMESSS